MENEKNFNPDSKENEVEPRSHEIRFDFDSFDDTKESIDTDVVRRKLDTWWDNICAANEVDPRDGNLEHVGYFIIELGKNAFENAHGGEIRVTFEEQKITVVVTDKGPGFENPNDDIAASPEHGLSELRDYADELTIETNSTKFTKVPDGEELVRTDDTDVKQGAKITFVKNL